MQDLLEITGAADPSWEALMRGVELVRARGDVVALKLDGQRSVNPYTILIIFGASKSREMVRVDGEALKPALLKALALYTQS